MSLKHAILVLLETEPGSGYDLLKRFNERLGYFWNATHQQIYQELKKMHQAELINLTLETQDGKPNRKVYSVTASGREDLIQWISEPTKPNKVNDHLLVKLYAGAMVEPQLLLKELARYRKNQERMLHTFRAIEQEYQSLPNDEKQPYRLPYLTLRRGILDKEAWLQWADEVQTELQNLAESEFH